MVLIQVFHKNSENSKLFAARCDMKKYTNINKTILNILN